MQWYGDMGLARLVISSKHMKYKTLDLICVHMIMRATVNVSLVKCFFFLFSFKLNAKNLRSRQHRWRSVWLPHRPVQWEEADWALVFHQQSALKGSQAPLGHWATVPQQLVTDYCKPHHFLLAHHLKMKVWFHCFVYVLFAYSSGVVEWGCKDLVCCEWMLKLLTRFYWIKCFIIYSIRNSVNKFSFSPLF